MSGLLRALIDNDASWTQNHDSSGFREDLTCFSPGEGVRTPPRIDRRSPCFIPALVCLLHASIIFRPGQSISPPHLRTSKWGGD
jgi:hypothetical protein